MGARTNQLDISVVTYNSAKWLTPFFGSLLRQRFPLAHIALLIRDNGSTDGTVEALRIFQSEQASAFDRIEISEGPNVGFGRGHNANFKKATASFILVTNVDLEFEADTLSTLYGEAEIDSPDVASWECRQKPFEHPKVYNPVTGETLWSSSACVLLRLSAVQGIGGYEPLLFLYGEDVELSYRLRDQGFKLRYVPKATVWHHTYETPEQVKPAQFLGSTLANVLLRCRYGRLSEILQGFLMHAGLFLLKPRFPGQRRKLLGQTLKLIALAPRFLWTRKTSNAPFPFRMWDYCITREGAFHAYPQGGPQRSPLVSVLVRTMPGYGGRLREAVTSVMRQTYTPIQLVIVEDGGDSASSFVEEIRASGRFVDVRYVALEKSGRCRAGNMALEKAHGQLICFLDDDDLFYADHLEVLVTAWIQQPSLGAVYGLAYEVRTEVLCVEPWIYKDILHSLHYRQAFSRPLLWHHNYLPIQTVLFRRDLYELYGGFDIDLDNLEDWNLWVRYSLKHDFLLVPKVTSLYRVPADVEKAVQRQGVLDDYYAAAQAKHEQLKVELSPPEVLRLSKEIARELYISLIPAAPIRQSFIRNPILKKLYYPAKRAWAFWRAIRSR